MGLIPISQAGLALSDLPTAHNVSSKSTTTPPLVVQLDLAKSEIDELLKESRNGAKGIHVSMGEAPVLHIGHKTIALEIASQVTSSNLYKHEPRDGRGSLQLVASIKTRLGSKKRDQVMAELDLDDPALLALRAGMADAERKKQSRTTLFVKDSSALQPAPKKFKRAPISSGPLGVKSHRVGMFGGNTTKSMPTSPSLGASRSPLPSAALIEKSRKLDALKHAIMHILAIRPVSQKYLATTVKCTLEDCDEVLQKYGRPSRIDASKFDLSDKGFKELDIWNFPYQSDSDRQAAIDRAVSAYDRQRVSTVEKIWQLLLPKEERGKGKILSKLQLHGKPFLNNTPRINVENAEEGKTSGDATGSEDEKRRGRLAPSDAEAAPRSRSQDPLKKKKISEKEAQSKRLLSKNPKKATKPKEAPKPKETAKPKDSMQAVKKEHKKTALVIGPKVKSAEFVHDSDEDIVIGESITVTSVLAAKSKAPNGKGSSGKATKTSSTPAASAAKAKSAVAVPKKVVSTPVSVPTAAVDKKATPSSSSSSGASQKVSSGSQIAAPMRRTISHQRNTSSPIKPSPLGSSPPTNASDFEDSRSLQPSSRSSPIASPAKAPDTPALKGPVNKPTRAVENNSEPSLKRKASSMDADARHPPISLTNDDPNHSAKRRQVSPPASDTSSSGGSISPPFAIKTLDQARRFKLYWTKYEKAYNEVSAMVDPPQEKVEQVLKMHKKLEDMKKEIARQMLSR
ncbi:MAG: hypothetical protein MMC33_000207 [Icmadophila ericetorum]|nr:hypothetical protein [Icmadophila ericetorum]